MDNNNGSKNWGIVFVDKILLAVIVLIFLFWGPKIVLKSIQNSREDVLKTYTEAKKDLEKSYIKTQSKVEYKNILAQKRLIALSNLWDATNNHGIAMVALMEKHKRAIKYRFDVYKKKKYDFNLARYKKSLTDFWRACNRETRDYSTLLSEGGVYLGREKIEHIQKTIGKGFTADIKESVIELKQWRKIETFESSFKKNYTSLLDELQSMIQQEELH